MKSIDLKRHRYYRLLQVAKKQLEMSEDDYRELLKKYGATEKAGRLSATTLTVLQLEGAYRAMKALGFIPKHTVIRISDWRKPRIAKITALWCALADAGVVKQRSERAMQKWCATLTKKARLNWAESRDLNMCVEALKAWSKRESVTE